MQWPSNLQSMGMRRYVRLLSARRPVAHVSLGGLVLPCSASEQPGKKSVKSTSRRPNDPASAARRQKQRRAAEAGSLGGRNLDDED